MYMGREAMTGGTTAHTTAAYAVDNRQTGLVSYVCRDLSW